MTRAKCPCGATLALLTLTETWESTWQAHWMTKRHQDYLRPRAPHRPPVFVQ